MKISHLLMMTTSFLSLTAFAETSELCPGEDGYYYTNYRTTNNPVQGGFVAHTATIGDTTRIMIGKKAAICGDAIIDDSAMVSGNVIVRGNARVTGSAKVTGNLILEGNVRVSGRSILNGSGTISTGSYTDVEKTFSSGSGFSSGSSSGGESAYALSEKLQAYIYKNVSYLVPTEGSYYTSAGEHQVRQKVRFGEGPCLIKLMKSRMQGDGNTASSFDQIEETTINLRNATQAIMKYYGPGFSTANIQVSNRSTQATRIHKLNSQYSTESMYDGWTDMYIRYDSNTAAAIEATSRADSEAITSLLNRLINACKN